MHWLPAFLQGVYRREDGLKSSLGRELERCMQQASHLLLSMTGPAESEIQN